MIAAPMGFGLAATAEPAIHLLLGAEWQGAAPFMKIVAVYSAFYAVYKVIASSLQAAGFARRAAYMSGSGALCLTITVAGAAWFRPDAMTVALAAFAANFLVLASGIAVIARYSKQNPFALGLHVFRPFAAAAAMAAAVRLLARQRKLDHRPDGRNRRRNRAYPFFFGCGGRADARRWRAEAVISLAKCAAAPRRPRPGRPDPWTDRPPSAGSISS